MNTREPNQPRHLSDRTVALVGFSASASPSEFRVFRVFCGSIPSASVFLTGIKALGRILG
jgi:hypothetical protein